MRIAIIAPPWLPVPPSMYGGAERVINDLAYGLDKQENDVLLITVAESSCPVRKGWFYTKAQIDKIGNVVVEMRHVVEAYNAVQDYDIVHDQTVSGPTYSYRFPRLPVVTTNHAPFTSDLGPVYRAAADKVPILAVSHHQASMAGDIPVAGVIHHGVDTNRFPVGSGGGAYFAYLGRMAPGKGVREATAIARAAGVPLKIAAKMREPAEQQYFEGFVKPLLSREVEYVGEINEREKHGLLGEAVALLNPISWPEPFGLVIVEALACGTPVLGTPHGATAELVEDGVSGFIGRSHDELVALAHRVTVLDRRACRRRAEVAFSASRMVREHQDFYRRVLIQHRRSAHPSEASG